MEKAAGVQLDQVWPKMDIQERFALTKSIARLQKAWMSTSFQDYGSLFYSPDLDESIPCGLINIYGYMTKDSRFTVGPSAGREFFDDGRINVKFDIGPCRQSYLQQGKY